MSSVGQIDMPALMSRRTVPAHSRELSLGGGGIRVTEQETNRAGQRLERAVYALTDAGRRQFCHPPPS